MKQNEDLTSEKRLWSQLWIWVRGDQKMLMVLSGIILVNMLVSIAAPLMLKEALDIIETMGDFTRMEPQAIVFTIIYACLLVAAFFTQVLQARVVAIVNAKFTHVMRIDAYRKILNNTISFYDKAVSGRLVSRVLNDANELTNSAQRLSNSLSQFFVMLGVLIVMLIYDPILAITSIAVAPILYFTVISMRKMQRRISLRWREKIGQVNANFGEIMSSIVVSKSFGREPENYKRFSEYNEQTYQSAKIRGYVVFLVAPIQDFLKHIGIIALLYVSSLRLTYGLTISMIYLFVLLQGYLYDPISQIARAYNQFQNSFAALERILEIMADDSTQEPDYGSLQADFIDGKIQFKRLSFAYEEDETVIDNIDLLIPAGTTLALVGHTGAGKSTIVSLLMRFYGGYSGELLLDDKSIADYHLQSLRQSIAYVAQDVLLFSGTILDNLLMTKPHASMTEIWKAIDAVHAREFLETLPLGVHTVLTEGGSNLSQGQRQMIALARALLADPKVLILDEFTASLDLYTESKIQQGIAALIQDRTSIVIAHRLTTILQSDSIVVLKNGAIVEQGTHEELMTGGKEYAQLFTKYFSFQIADLELKQLYLNE